MIHHIKQKCLPESDLQGRADAQRSASFPSICQCSMRQNIREKNRLHETHGYQKNSSSPKTHLENHHLADPPQRKQQRADRVFEAVDLSINRQSPPAVPNPDPTWRKEGWQEGCQMRFSQNRAENGGSGKYRKMEEIWGLQTGVVARTRN